MNYTNIAVSVNVDSLIPQEKRRKGKKRIRREYCDNLLLVQLLTQPLKRQWLIVMKMSVTLLMLSLHAHKGAKDGGNDDNQKDVVKQKPPVTDVRKALVLRSH